MAGNPKPKITRKDNKFIKCPFCGTEYLVSEIYMPGDFLGKPKPDGIVKDPLGKIILAEYEIEPSFIEHFECEKCGKAFQVEAKVSFVSEPEPEETDFQDDSVSLL